MKRRLVIAKNGWALALALGAVSCGVSGAEAPTTEGTAEGSQSLALAPLDLDGDSVARATAVRCSGKRGWRGDRTVRVEVGGTERVSLLHVPAGYDPTHGDMLVLNFHGRYSTGLQQKLLTGMDLVSNDRGFLVAYPQSTGIPTNGSWNAGTCCGDAADQNVDDVGFVKALLAAIEDDYCIDRKRVFATGFSNGGYFSHRLACDMADTFAAVAPVSGLLAVPACAPSRPVPILTFHGTRDPVVIMEGGTGILGGPNAPVEDTFAAWRRLDGCTEAKTSIFAKGDVACTRWAECAPGGELVTCVVDGGGHTWPGGLPTVVVGKTTFAISATKAIIDFFASHPMP